MQILVLCQVSVTFCCCRRRRLLFLRAIQRVRFVFYAVGVLLLSVRQYKNKERDFASQCRAVSMAGRETAAPSTTRALDLTFSPRCFELFVCLRSMAAAEITLNCPTVCAWQSQEVTFDPSPLRSPHSHRLVSSMHPPNFTLQVKSSFIYLLTLFQSNYFTCYSYY